MSPLHSRLSRAVFVSHSVERLAWVRTIAGQPMTEPLGVPVRWRGCMPTCLDFLDADERPATDVGDNPRDRSHEPADGKIDGAELDGAFSAIAVTPCTFGAQCEEGL